MRTYLLLTLALAIAGCTGLPQGIQPVKGFSVDRYLGKWYEIARLDHSFEHGLNNVSATYSMRKDGGVKVVNRGFSTEKNKWKQAEGKAYFMKEKTLGHLKVSFFGPFYGSYAIFELDRHYQYAFISGYNNSYLWLLSRSPEVSPELLLKFKSKARDLGFNIDNLILVNHDKK